MRRKAHIIAIGGSVMHALALHLHQAGYEVTGSDDRIDEPARSRLAASQILPPREGWFPEKITPDLDIVLVGKHATPDNPELQKALALNLPIQDFPTYLIQATQHTHRIVIAGSHGKTTTTGAIMHVMRKCQRPFDYLVGAQIPHFPTNLHLSHAPTLILEGDEYPASALNPLPKIAIYQAHWGILTGIAWDHVNVYPTQEAYVKVFADWIGQLPKGGLLIYNALDPKVKTLAKKYLPPSVHAQPYKPFPYRLQNQTTWIQVEKYKTPILLYGRHNVSNLSAAYVLLRYLGITAEEFAEAIRDYQGPHLRLQTLYEDDKWVLIRDFAHSPSKVHATLHALAEKYPDYTLTACLELHTYSSLQPHYLRLYKKALQKTQHALIYVSEKILNQRNSSLSLESIPRLLGLTRESLVQSWQQLLQKLQNLRRKKSVIVLMSSGSFDGMPLERLMAP
ncbi:MAG: UDP-N-acetylmuramate--L-alanine ligase [Bacteroidia bacterium]